MPGLTKPCSQCGEPAYVQDEGRCEFCATPLCFRHTIRTTFYGEWVSWCQACYDQHEIEQGREVPHDGR